MPLPPRYFDVAAAPLRYFAMPLRCCFRHAYFSRYAGRAPCHALMLFDIAADAATLPVAAITIRIAALSRFRYDALPRYARGAATCCC